MSVVWTNLDFEYELRFGERRLNKHLRKMNDRWSHILRLMPGFEDASLAESSADDVMVWGVTKTAAKQFLMMSKSDIDVIRAVNSKIYSHRLEVEFGCALPASRVVTSLEEIRTAFQEIDTALVKHPFGVSGRDRIKLRNEITDPQIEWLTKNLDETPLVFEPKVEISKEYSLQFELSDAADFLGASSLLTDAHGQHRGHRREVEVPRQILVDAQAAAERVHQEGYRGPMGIDAFSGTIGGEFVNRSLCEINARVTFGRLALELFKRDENAAIWWHPSERRRREVGRLLPEFCDPGGRSGSVLLDDIDLERVAL